MLLLSRRHNGRIMIGDDIQITVADIRGTKVTIGIDAPVDIPIHRKEVYDAIKRKAQSGDSSNNPEG
ncbi:MAG: carbon storage regulator [Planctomycetota bacterium]|nr:MAG: carbon storage regulator [Planctomycetota bacterium]